MDFFLILHLLILSSHLYTPSTVCILSIWESGADGNKTNVRLAIRNNPVVLSCSSMDFVYLFQYRCMYRIITQIWTKTFIYGKSYIKSHIFKTTQTLTGSHGQTALFKCKSREFISTSHIYLHQMHTLPVEYNYTICYGNLITQTLAFLHTHTSTNRNTQRQVYKCTRVVSLYVRQTNVDVFSHPNYIQTKTTHDCSQISSFPN